jgi:hypothetical protein
MLLWFLESGGEDFPLADFLGTDLAGGREERLMSVLGLYDYPSVIRRESLYIYIFLIFFM